MVDELVIPGLPRQAHFTKESKQMQNYFNEEKMKRVHEQFTKFIAYLTSLQEMELKDFFYQSIQTPNSTVDL